MKTKKMIKTLFAGLLCGLLLLALTACGSSTPVIGISQYGEHASLDNCRIGFLQGLAEAGLTEGKDYTVDYQNAGFDDNVAIQIGQRFSANKSKSRQATSRKKILDSIQLPRTRTSPWSSLPSPTPKAPTSPAAT